RVQHFLINRTLAGGQVLHLHGNELLNFIHIVLEQTHHFFLQKFRHARHVHGHSPSLSTRPGRRCRPFHIRRNRARIQARRKIPKKTSPASKRDRVPRQSAPLVHSASLTSRLCLANTASISAFACSASGPWMCSS